MDRRARHHAARALSLAFVGAAGAAGAFGTLAAGCTDDAGCPDVAATFALTTPGGAVELIPGASVRLAWTAAAAADATIGFALVDGDTRVVLPAVPVADGGVDLVESPTGAPVPPGIYRLEGTFGGCAATPTIYDGGPLRLIYAQGVGFTATQLAFTGSQATRPIELRTVSLSTLTLELLVDPTPESSGDELIIARTTVPGELVAMVRALPFTGLTVDGAAVPDGAYQVRARVHARDDTLVYEVPGPGLTWAAGG